MAEEDKDQGMTTERRKEQRRKGYCCSICASINTDPDFEKRKADRRTAPASENQQWNSKLQPNGTVYDDATLIEIQRGEIAKLVERCNGLQRQAAPATGTTGDADLDRDLQTLHEMRHPASTPPDTSAAPTGETPTEGFCANHAPNASRRYAGCVICSRNEESALIEEVLKSLGWAHDEEAEENLSGSQWYCIGEEERGTWDTAEAINRALEDYDALRDAYKRTRLALAKAPAPVPADPPSALKETDFDIPRDNRFHPWTFPEKPAASAPEGEARELAGEIIVWAMHEAQASGLNTATNLEFWTARLTAYAHRSALDAARIEQLEAESKAQSKVIEQLRLAIARRRADAFEEAAKMADEWDDQRFATNMDCYDFMLKSGVPEDTDAAWGKIETARAIAAALRERAKETR